MGSIAVRIQEPERALALAGERTARTINDFLAWLETSKGLRLCEAFKPQYDWYVPVPANIKGLTREFLGKAGSTFPMTEL